MHGRIIGIWGAWEDHWYMGCMGGALVRRVHGRIVVMRGCA